MQFLLEVITPERKVFTEEVNEVTVPTANGTIGVLPRHMRLFSALVEGEVKITRGKSQFFLAIGGGFVDVTHDKVIILVSRAYHADELNESEIKQAQSRARNIILSKAKGEELAAAQAILRRSVLEMNVMRRHRRRQVSPLGSH